jgi:hypothetical protein
MINVQCPIEARLHHGIWRITLDGLFYGDYRSKSNAAEAIHQIVGNLLAQGRKGVVTWKE